MLILGVQVEAMSLGRLFKGGNIWRVEMGVGGEGNKAFWAEAIRACGCHLAWLVQLLWVVKLVALVSLGVGP